MSHLKGRRPSPALIVAILALFVALGGTVYAASSINGKLVKKNSLPGNRIKKNTVTGTQVKESSLGQVPSAVSAETAKTATTANPAAYAHIFGNGAVDGSDTFNISSANVTHPEEGVYCLTGLSFTPHAVMAQVDSGDGPGVTETSVLLGNFIACPKSSNAEIVTYNPATIEFGDYGGGLYVVVF
jgi:hypothetical protein